MRDHHRLISAEAVPLCSEMMNDSEDSVEQPCPDSS